MRPGLREAWSGRRGVLLTHPKSREVPCVLSKQVEVPAGQKMVLEFEVNNHPKGDWLLVVKVDGVAVVTQAIEESVWQAFKVDLSVYAGKTVRLELENRLKGDWRFEAGYWSGLKIIRSE
mgnify:FL=1